MNDFISRKELLKRIDNRIADYRHDRNIGWKKFADCYQFDVKPLIENLPSALELESVIEKLKRNEESMLSAIEKELDKELTPAVKRLFQSYTDSQIEILKTIMDSGKSENR